MRPPTKLKWDAEADCEKGAASLLPILLCANVVCSNRGTCSPNANLDDYVCTCNNTAAGGGGTWGGKDCQLCNGVEPQPSPKPFCSTLNLDMCNGQDSLRRACPKRSSTMAPTPVSKGRSMSGGGVAALVIVLLLVLVAVGFAGRHQGWVQAPACLSSIKNRHAQYGDGGDGIAFDL
eukprot:gene3353-28128_t